MHLLGARGTIDGRSCVSYPSASAEASNRVCYSYDIPSMPHRATTLEQTSLYSIFFSSSLSLSRSFVLLNTLNTQFWLFALLGLAQRKWIETSSKRENLCIHTHSQAIPYVSRIPLAMSWGREEVSLSFSLSLSFSRRQPWNHAFQERSLIFLHTSKRERERECVWMRERDTRASSKLSFACTDSLLSCLFASLFARKENIEPL